MRSRSLKIPSIIIVIGLILAIAANLLVSIQKKPTISEHDFNFSITYKLDGETKTFKGVYTSRFTGFGANGTDPLCRYYEGSYKMDADTDGDRRFTIAEKDGYELYIVALLDDCYLMDDKKNESYQDFLDDPVLEAIDKDGNQYADTDLPDVFDAEIISWDYPEPIENSFTFAGFSGLNVNGMMVMTLVGLLVIVLCMIFARKAEGVTYSVLDILSIILNFAIIFFALPIISIVAAVIQAFPTGPDWIYQADLCVPQIIPFTVAASLSLRRKGFRKSGFFITFLAPVVLAILIILEYVL